MISRSRQVHSRPRRPLADPAKLAAVIDAISNYDPQKSPAWDDLDALSSHTYVDEIEAVPEGIFETDDGFSAAATVYVALNYGNQNDEEAISDSFPAQADGHFEAKGNKITAVIDSFSVDTSSFDH
jgi:predicted pPIWI-associating nuclease